MYLTEELKQRETNVQLKVSGLLALLLVLYSTGTTVLLSPIYNSTKIRIISDNCQKSSLNLVLAQNLQFSNRGLQISG